MTSNTGTASVNNTLDQEPSKQERATLDIATERHWANIMQAA